MERLGEDVLEAVAALWNPHNNVRYRVQADTSIDWTDDEGVLVLDEKGVRRIV
jgi:hypothetical protein